uniref:Carnitine palmitoyltransferase 1A2b n=1 Tax=Hucho hucho TaxID=62062 RepID=A0A4W5PJQ9_9TELE
EDWINSACRRLLSSKTSSPMSYLESVRPLLSGPGFERMTVLAAQFENSLGNRLQRYLKLKALWATNYVSDWWEDNYNGMVLFISPSHSLSQSRVPGTVVPLCAAQCERMFNTTCTPVEEMGNHTHTHIKESQFWNLYFIALTIKEIRQQYEYCSASDTNQLNISLMFWLEQGMYISALIVCGQLSTKSAALIDLVLSISLSPVPLSLVPPFSLSLCWFDKSFSVVVYKNGNNGLNAEHSWADNAFQLGYTEDGHCKGEVQLSLPPPQRLTWDIPVEQVCISLSVAQALADDVDCHVFPFRDFGKRRIKKLKISLDTFIQLALQLAYYRVKGNTFCLTYEASVTRLFQEGRNETVRSCSNEGCAFGKAVESVEVGLLTDWGCFNSVLSEPWHLSTSQTPVQQLDPFDMKNHPDFISLGGGFGPVADDGYGVSYIIVGEDMINYHVSCKQSFSEMVSISRALLDLLSVLTPAKTENPHAQDKKQQ